MGMNFRQNPLWVNIDWSHQPTDLPWSAGRQKLSEFTEYHLEMLKAKCFFGQSRLPWLLVKRCWCCGWAQVMSPTTGATTCADTVEQHRWLGTQGSFTLSFSSAKPHSTQPVTEIGGFRPGWKCHINPVPCRRECATHRADQRFGHPSFRASAACLKAQAICLRQ